MSIINFQYKWDIEYEKDKKFDVFFDLEIQAITHRADMLARVSVISIICKTEILKCLLFSLQSL